jgi:hypothetical protein
MIHKTKGNKNIDPIYQEPFGDWTSSHPSKEFPCFDFNFLSILFQRDSVNCGFAALANSFAFVKHLKDVDFVTNDMNKVDEAHFFLHYDKYTL